MDGITIAACGKGIPRHSLHNRDLEGFLDTSHAWILSRTGIEERRVADPEEDNISLSLEACRMALERSGLDGGDVDLIVVATATPDRLVPSLACTLQRELGSRGPALDINAGCSGFVYALVIALQLMRGGLASRALVVGTETLTRIVDWRDRSTCVIFGDGAGAVLLAPCPAGEGIIASSLDAQGGGDRLIRAEGGGARMMASLMGGLPREVSSLPPPLPDIPRSWGDAYPFIRMDGREVFRFAVNKLCATVRELCAAAGVRMDDIALVIPHQANLRILNASAERLGCPPDIFFTNIHRYGNTSSASIPIALEEALHTGLIGEGDLVVLAAFGAGMTWGGVLLRWHRGTATGTGREKA
ncbi:MAG: beta-ketoacyl-ACP synthase III [Actinomycetota bacterium]|nr:beta-ketoacyl-ACP synthase III [Actinomycetota bacterium]